MEGWDNDDGSWRVFDEDGDGDGDTGREVRRWWRALVRTWPWNRPVTASQRGSMFFRLPLEVRCMVYREVLGGSTMHVFLHGRRHLVEPQEDVDGWGRAKLCCLRCRRLDDDAEEGVRCWTQHRTRVHGFDCARAGGDGFPRERPLSLLLSCRRVYIEAIDTLYATNTFDFDCADSLFRFIRRVPPQCLAAVRAVRFYTHYRPSRLKYLFIPRTWTPLWEALSTMNRLEHVHAIVNVEKRMDMYNDPDLFTCPWDKKMEVELFAPLGLMARRESDIKLFKLDVKWALGGEATVLVPGFCKVSRVVIPDD